MTATDARRMVMLENLREAARDRDTLDGLVRALSFTLADVESDPFLRSRAADAASALPRRYVAPMVADYLDDDMQSVRFFTARTLHRMGDQRGTDALKDFLEHRSESVRDMAARALDSAYSVDR